MGEKTRRPPLLTLWCQGMLAHPEGCPDRVHDAGGCRRVCCCCLLYSPWWGNLKRGCVKKFFSFWREMTGVAQAMPVRSMAADVLRKAKRLGKAVLSWRAGEFSIRAACRARWATHTYSEGKGCGPSVWDAEMGVASHRRSEDEGGKEKRGGLGGPFCPTLLPAGDQRVEPITGFLPAARRAATFGPTWLSRPHTRTYMHTTTTSVMVTLFLLAAPLYIHKLARGHRSNRSGLSATPPLLFNPPLWWTLGRWW